MIYFDNAATTLIKPPQVIEAVAQAMGSMGNPSRGTHDSALSASRAVYDARCLAAGLFGCPRPDNVVFTSNSTEALNIAITGLAEKGSHVISTQLEHNSVLRPLYRLEAEGTISLSLIEADSRGQIDYGDFEAAITDKTRLIVCTHASNLTGDMLDIARVGRIARAHGILFIVDASQTAGCHPIDMQSMGIDVLCFTGHKGLMGPQGTGGLCIADGVEIRPWKVGGTGVQSFSRSQPSEYPTRLEAGTLNAHGLAGLAAALRFIGDTGLENIRQKEIALMHRFYDGIRDIPGIRIYGDFSTDQRCAIVTLNLGDHDSAVLADELSENYSIATRPGAHCAPLLHQALGTAQQGAVRFSFSYYNTEDEVDAAIAALKELAE